MSVPFLPFLTASERAALASVAGRMGLRARQGLSPGLALNLAAAPFSQCAFLSGCCFSPLVSNPAPRQRHGQ